MNSQMNPGDPRDLWQKQATEQISFRVGEIRNLAGRFERRIHWRNLREYAAAAIAIAFFLARLPFARGWDLLPPCFLIAGTAYVAWQLHRRGSAQALPSEAGEKDSLRFYHEQLRRQRDALSSIWKWYLLPVLPGFLASIAIGLVRGANKTFVSFLGTALVFLYLVIWQLNERAANKIDREMRNLEQWQTHD